MFQAKIILHQLGVAAEPLFITLRCLDDIHLRSVGNDRTGSAKCQRGKNQDALGSHGARRNGSRDRSIRMPDITKEDETRLKTAVFAV
jgi:hypothetical protein